MTASVPRPVGKRRLAAAGGLALLLAAGGASAAQPVPAAPPEARVVAVPAAVMAPVPDTMAQRLLACTTCHGKEGRASNTDYFPRIAGKPAGYLYNQLVNFREQRRGNATMAYFTATMSDAYLREIAEHFAALDLPYPPPQRSAVSAAQLAQLARGETLVRQGDAAQRLPACISCHGSAMTGVQPSVPGLLGLPPAYLAGQLGAWRTGQRHAAAPDCMADIARRLPAGDLTAVVAWLEAQPVPAAAHAAGAAPAAALPVGAERIACGSMPVAAVAAGR